MASTNKTTNYNLSQFIGSDKPAWLSDYNQDMSKIDTGLKNAADTATSASGTATAANTAIGDITNLNTTAKTDLVAAINEVDTNADTAQNTANTASTTATAARDAAAALTNTLNINTYKSYSNTDVTCTGGTCTGGTMYVASNSQGTLFKVYGNFVITSSASAGNQIRITLPNTGISRDAAYTIANAGIGYCTSVQNNGVFINAVSIDVDATGNLVLSFTVQGPFSYVARLFPCLYFNSDFGDITPSA